ncbi:uncharacterized protein LOC121856464 [Homarus americanus]|nr:uncharacterized protein LOC121856464 [Homarus americanus]
MILPQERPLEVKAQWPRDRQAEFVFVLRRNMSQALSLRRLSLRTGDTKRPTVAGSQGEQTHFSPRLQWSQWLGTSWLPPPPSQKTAKTQDRINVLIIEEAVIDCTDVTPKMTTINRTATQGCKGALEVFNGTTSTSAINSQLHHNTSTRDSSTNTDRKTWSNTSTQTNVSKKFPRSASLPRDQNPSRDRQTEDYLTHSEK